MTWPPETSEAGSRDGTPHAAVHYGRGHGRRANHSAGSVSALYESPHLPTPRFPGRPSHHYHHHHHSAGALARQESLLGHLCSEVLAGAEIERGEIAQKEAFRVSIQEICRRVITNFELKSSNSNGFDRSSVQLRCFGSLSSGFATKAADMDLGLLSPNSVIQPDAPGSPIPRLIERAFLDAGLGARLLTRTRVPIIKLCESPSEKLLADLRREREKWESGVDLEEGDAADDEEQEEGDDDHGSARGVFTHGREKSFQARPSQDMTLDPLQSHAHDGPRRTLLRQAENQSLSSYYASAKRALRKLGGRDLTISNQKDFGIEDSAILIKVCEAFVHGLRNTVLRQRLAAYPSLQFDQMLDQGCARTLVGVFAQVEGEAVLLEWEGRKVRERTDDYERQLAQTVKTWKTLHDRVTHRSEAIYHGKELQNLLDKIKRFRSVQLVLLEQAQFESASHYHERALKVRGDIKPATGYGPEDVEEELKQRYVSGIFCGNIRRAAEELISAQDGRAPTLDEVVVRHKSLQLALELERAHSQNLYPDADACAISTYIALLRVPLKAIALEDGRSRLAVPIDENQPEHREILKQIRKLSDPATLAPNQPRDPYKDKLEFPKTGAGVQCDINFSAHLALQNTLLLRCYSHIDGRVRPLVLFVKHWAKVRGVNTPYRGTLSSYGYVLMVLHFLVNVAQPFVCPNLQQLGYNSQPHPGTTEGKDETISCKGRDVRFWRDEEAIMRLARSGEATQNTDSIGYLLRGFFEYYAHSGPLSTLSGRGFDWGREVLSLRTMGGLLTKQEKGWTGAKTVTVVEQTTSEPPPPPMVSPDEQNPAESLGREPSQSPGPVQPKERRQTHSPQKSCEVKEVRHRYLFAVEDPFETDHNVARTVTHNGIVAIRDEFRRAWRIIQAAGQGRPLEELLLQEATTEHAGGAANAFSLLLDELHGSQSHVGGS